MITVEKRSYIEGTEPELAELYRSANLLVLPVEGGEIPEAQGIVCALRRDGRFHVYVALYFKEIKRALVLAVDKTAEGHATCAGPLEKGCEFASSLGFELDHIQLKYSPAMREVILRQVPVIFPPREGEKMLLDRATELKELERVVAEEAETDETADDSALPPDKRAERKGARDKRAAAAKAAALQLAAGKRWDEQLKVLQRGIEESLERFNESEVPTAVVGAGARGSAMDDGRQSKPDGDQKQVANLEKQLATLQKQLEAGRNEQVALEKKSAADRKRIAELEQLLEGADKSLARITESFKSMETAAAALEKELAQAKAENASIRSDTEQLRQQLLQSGESEKRIAVLEESLRLALEKGAADRKRLEDLQAELGKTQAAARQTENRAEHVQQALAAAKEVLEQRLAGLAGTSPPAAVSPAITPATAPAPAAAPSVAAAAPVPAASPAPAAATPPPPTVEAPPPSPPAKSKPGILGTPEKGGAPPHVVRRPPPPGAFFHVDWDLEAVPCTNLKALCEIHHSIGMVQLSLEGYPNQYCSACILVVENGENKSLYMAFWLSTSARTLVYVPAKQPDTPAALSKAMKEAVKFLTVVGMDVEQLPLTDRPEKLLSDVRAVLDLPG